MAGYWLDCNDVNQDFENDNFNVLRDDRKNKRGGGVLSFISKQFSCKLINDMSYYGHNIDNQFECVTAEIDIDKGRHYSRVWPKAFDK